MDRRRFLRTGILAGGLALGAGGFLSIRRSHARSKLGARLLGEALPPLSSNAAQELQTLPVRARGDVERYFHGRCLNVEGFVSQICSASFHERIGRCRSQEEREGCFFHAFCNRVVTETEILNQVTTVAANVGRELDAAWGRYCAELSVAWNVHIRGHGSPLSVEDLAGRLGDLIRSELTQAVRQAAAADLGPALGQTIGNIGQSALLLLPLVRFGKVGLAVGIPVFVVLAARHVWDYAMARREDRRADYQAAISGRLARLGQDAGAEFETEVRRRLADLHAWQERSVRQTAHDLAGERVGLLGGVS